MRALACLALFGLLSSAARAQWDEYAFEHSVCPDSGALMRAGFETGDAGRDGGGPSPGRDTLPVGAVDLMVGVPDAGTLRSVRLYVPTSYDPATPAPLVLALHGASGSSATAPAAADAVRALWAPVAEREGAIVLAPVAGGSQGGWVPDSDTPMLACALAQVAARWAVDLDRRHLWGFSAGGHYGHAIALGNAGRFASYAVNAGALLALTCATGGGPADCAHVLPQARRTLPVSLRVGSADALRPHVLGDRSRLQQAGWQMPTQLQYAEFAGGHTLSADDVEAAWAWFEAHPRHP